MSDKVKMDFHFPKLAEKFKRHEDEIKLLMIATVQANRGMLFDAEGAYNSHPKWAPLKFRQGQILKDRGNLSRSIAPGNPTGRAGIDGIAQFRGDMIEIGSTLAYARLMNDGTTKMPDGKLTAKNAKALRIPLPPGKKASDFAKTASKTASTGRSFIKKTNEEIKEMRSDIRSTLNPKRRRALGKLIKKKQDQINRTNPSSKYMFRKSVKIPARPFDQWNQQDQMEMEATVSNKLLQILFEGD